MIVWCDVFIEFGVFITYSDVQSSLSSVGFLVLVIVSETCFLTTNQSQMYPHLEKQEVR